MSAPIGPGDFVICVDAAPGFGRWEPGAALTEGALYQVEEIFIGPRAKPDFQLVGKRRGPEATLLYGCRCGYRPSRFRPFLDPNAVARSLKAPPINARTRVPEIV